MHLFMAGLSRAFDEQQCSRCNDLFLPHLSSILDFNFIQKSGSLQKYKNKNKNKKMLLFI